MRSVKVELRSVDAVQAFVEAVSPLEGDFELISDGYILDAKSLMGIFSLDLSRPIELKIYKDTPGTVAVLRRFMTGGIPAGKDTHRAENADGEGV